MFEKYTEKARRLIFFARYEVSELGGSSIEPEHLLLGFLRENQALVAGFLPANVAVEEIRNQIVERARMGAKILCSVNVPLSKASQEVLMSAAEESEVLGHKHIGPEHILLGLLHVKGSLAEKALLESGVNLADARHQFGGRGER